MISPRQVSPQLKIPSTVKNDFTAQQILNTLKEGLKEGNFAIQNPDDVPKNDEPKKKGPKCLYLKKFIIGCFITSVVSAIWGLLSSLSTFDLGTSKFLK